MSTKQEYIKKMERLEQCEVGGHKIWVGCKMDGPYSIQIFREDKDNPGNPETTPFATVDRPEKVSFGVEYNRDGEEVVVRCGDRVTTFKNGHLENAICWALGVDPPVHDPNDIATLTSRYPKK